MKLSLLKGKWLFVLSLLMLPVMQAKAQTTAFNYQGKLSDSTGPANGGFQLQFKLFEAATGGNQIGNTLMDVPVTATAGVFSTKLDFGSSPFGGSDRFLEIAVRRTAGEDYTTLAPRQQISSTPYSIRTLSAAQADVALDANKLGGVDASEYVKTSTVGSAFVKNTTTQQTGTNFNIDGSGIFGGNVGVGTVTPQAKLHTVGSSWFQGDSTPLPAAAGKGIVVGFGGENGYIAAFDYGSFTPKNLLLNNPGGNVGIGTLAPLATLHVGGNAVQDRDKGGMVKGVLHVDSQGTPLRCYNGVTGSSTGSCGFSVNRVGSGLYDVNFGFQVSDRFISVTTSSSSSLGNLNTSAQVGFDIRSGNSVVRVRTFVPTEIQQYTDSSFFIFVY